MDSQEQSSSAPGGFGRMVRALRYRNYRLFFMGQAISLLGTWMQSIATGWLVYRLTGSEALLGIVTFTGQIPALFATPFGGLVADRMDRRRMLVLTQCLSMVQAVLLAVLYYTHAINVAWIMVLAAFMGLVNAFDIPIRHSFVMEMIDKKEDLVNAIALNSSIFNAARLVGPSLAGLLVASMGEGICFLLNAISYAGVIAALLAMRIKSGRTVEINGHVLRDLKEGLSYVTGFPAIGSILLLLCLICVTPYTVLLPVFAKKIIHGGPEVYGFLMGFTGLGALVGAIYLASKPSPRGLEKTIALCAVVYGVGLCALAFLHTLSLSLALTVVIGFGMMITMAASNTVLQTIADDDKRGRVMSFYTLTFVGTAPVGSLVGGWLTERFSVSHTYLVSGLICVMGAVWFATKLPKLFYVAKEPPPNREPAYDSFTVPDSAPIDQFSDCQRSERCSKDSNPQPGN